ncbi:unnamed protein product [Amoebophrya sp. A120]|nr:unnamed protein product [Amoebophrya sp. A120]|eukprot:GSA120T00000745001.1
MVDKLSELRGKAGVSEPASRYGSLDEADADDLGGWGEGKTLMTSLVETSKELLPMTDSVRETSDRVRELTRQAVMATSAEKERKIGAAVSKYINEGKENIMQVKNMLDELKRLEIEEGDTMSPAETQMVHAIIRSASQRFKLNITDYMKAQEEYKTAVKSKVERQLRIAYPDAAEEEIQQLAEEDPLSVREAIQAQLKSGGKNSLQSTLYDLHEKYSDMKKLEESVLELHDLFLFLSALVDEQGMMLDSIEANVENTREYTGVAVEHLAEAKRSKDAYDRKRFWFYAMSVVSAIVCILVILCLLGPSLHFFSMFLPSGGGSNANNHDQHNSINNNNLRGGGGGGLPPAQPNG